MSKYRIRGKVSIIIDYVLVQEKRWYGWKTIARFINDDHGVQKAKQYINELEEIQL